MRFISTSILAILASLSLLSGAVADLDGTTSDVCGEVNSYLKVPNKFLPGKYITLGYIDACLCVSTIPHFMATNVFAIAAVALVGKSQTQSILTDMINTCQGHQTCHYPPHSSPVCSHGNPCDFTCKDGYTPYPSYKPTKCVCNKPYTECNGKCGIFHGCPSGHHYKREMHYGTAMQCAQGLTACGVFGRNARSWECINTQTDLESCGGCIVPLHADPTSNPDGVDCTAIAGVSDVSCVRGGCVVHKCMPGYDISTSGSTCIYSEDKDPAILAAQYGLEHVPL